CSRNEIRDIPPITSTIASRTNTDTDLRTAQETVRQQPQQPAWAKACQPAGRSDRRARPPRSDPDSAGTGAPTSPADSLPPSLTARQPPSGSIRPQTSSSCGPVATLPGSSIRPLAGAQNRTTRVLPNPDNSCAYDNYG